VTRPVAALAIGLAIASTAALVAAWRPAGSGPSLPTPTAAARAAVESAPLCPWREPQQDLQQFFPGATGIHEETRILSHLRVALLHDLGRPLTAEEMLLRPFRIMKGSEPVGTVLVRRVKGEFGAIELVLAVTPEGRVRGLRLQRQREPEAVAAVLTSPEWRGAFQEKSADSPLRVGKDLPAVSREATVSAQAIAGGVRSLLILLRAAELHGRAGGPAA
jgi:hypothetical protein